MSKLYPVEFAVENQQQHSETDFPYALVYRDTEASLADSVSWANEQKADLLNLANQHAAVLLRVFPIDSNCLQMAAAERGWQVCTHRLQRSPRPRTCQ